MSFLTKSKLPEGYCVQPLERFSFGFALLGQNFIYGLLLNYLMIYYTDIVGLTAAAVGTLFLIARCWDAVNDPFMGLLVDRTRSRWGKFRPYLLFTPIPIAIATTLCFTTIDVSPGLKLAFAYATYLIWGMIYTVNDVPLWSLSAAMSRNTQERTGIISIARMLAMVGIMIPAIFVIPLVNALGQGNDQTGYMATAALFGFGGAALMFLAFFNTKERVVQSTERPGFKQSFDAVAKNRPLQIIMAISLLNVFAMAAQSLYVFFATYNLGDRNTLPILMTLTITGMIIGMAPVPLLVSRIGKIGAFVVLATCKAIAAITFFFVGYESISAVYAMTLISALFTGGPIIIITAMLADSIDYMEWRAGNRSEGVIFSIQTFLAKFSSAIGGFLAGMALTVIGYVPNAAQSTQTLSGIFILITLIPGLGSLIALVPLKFYELNEDRHREINLELQSS